MSLILAHSLKNLSDPWITEIKKQNYEIGTDSKVLLRTRNCIKNSLSLVRSKGCR